MKSYVIHLLRHGDTAAANTRQYIGKTDLDLSPSGIAALKAKKEEKYYGAPTVFYSSPYRRCLQTVDELFHPHEILSVDGLRECNFGIFEGKTPEQLIDIPEYMHWIRDNEAPPNGEGGKEFSKRICSAFIQVVRDIMSNGATESVICTHGGVIMTLLAVYGLPRQNMTEWMCKSGEGFTIRVTPSVWMRTGMVDVLGRYPGILDDSEDESDGDFAYGDDFAYDDDSDDENGYGDVMWSDIEPDKDE